VVEDSTTSLAMAAQGLGITTITPLIVRLVPTPDVVHHELTDDVRRDVVLIRRRAGHERPSVAALAEIIRDLVAASTAS
jgi:DNA-binding transcriptional LysR family regulator